MNVKVLLSKLVAGQQNPRRVKPEREAHRRLVASIKAHGLLVPLLVHPVENGKFSVIAGNRRLAALKDVHRGDAEARVPCITRTVDADAADSMSLAENFAREPMHPLDEAEAFARLAAEERKGVETIATEFGVGETYVRQRMKLAGLADPVKAAFRKNEIGVGIAEAFAAVPTGKQEELWKETDGKPRDARQVRGLIEHEWIEGKHALFEVGGLDPAAVSHDLFGGELLIQRQAFMEAQVRALEMERTRLSEEGWKAVVVGEAGQLRDAVYRQEEAQRTFDAATTTRLNRLRAKREKLQEKPCKDEEAERKVQEELDQVEQEEEAIFAGQPVTFSEATKAKGTVFLLLYPHGEVERHYAVPRPNSKSQGTANGQTGEPGQGGPEGGGQQLDENDLLPTCDELSPKQLAELYSQEALAVREAASKDKLVRKRLIVLALHPRVRSGALTIRREVNITDRHCVGMAERYPLLAEQESRMNACDPFLPPSPAPPPSPTIDAIGLTEVEAYQKLLLLTEKELDSLIGLLVVGNITGCLTEATPLVSLLRRELGVNIRTRWTPDADWLSGYTKAHLADLIGKIGGTAAGQAALSRKKSELVAELAGVFDRTGNTPEDARAKEIAEQAWAWVPARVRDGVMDGEG